MRVGLAGLFFGVVFGFALGWAQVTDPHSIRQMLLLEDPYLFLMMGSGVATAFIGLRLLRWRKAHSLIGRERIELKTTAPRREHLWGSLIFGSGWALSLACPGPVTASLGRGQYASLLVAGGLFLGVGVAAWMKSRNAQQMARVGSPASADSPG